VSSDIRRTLVCGEPISFTVGGGMMIPGFDNGVRGMAVGDTKAGAYPSPLLSLT
jgi:FKBP-type peptidyl-prolyl cis-trans isomerase